MFHIPAHKNVFTPPAQVEIPTRRIEDFLDQDLPVQEEPQDSQEFDQE